MLPLISVSRMNHPLRKCMNRFALIATIDVNRGLFYIIFSLFCNYSTDACRDKVEKNGLSLSEKSPDSYLIKNYASSSYRLITSKIRVRCFVRSWNTCHNQLLSKCSFRSFYRSWLEPQNHSTTQIIMT